MAVLDFDGDDAFAGAELLEDPATVAQHREWRATASKASVSRDEFLRSL